MEKEKPHILFIDDDEDVLITAKVILRPYYTIQTASSPKQLEKMITQHDPEVIILDMNFKSGATSGNEGLFWLRKIKERDPSIEVIMNTAYGDIQLAVECMKEGAADFLVKPWEKEKLLTTVNNIMALRRSKKTITQLEATKTALNNDLEKGMGELIGESEPMQKVYETIKKVAGTDANILLLGENGTGKELVARAIHKLSKRKDKTFVKVDLGALSETLFESELFGHKKGAFTDAKDDRIGRFELADKGTLFLDEIGNISANHQTKLLSILQNRQVSRVGDHKLIDIDIRLISATNKPLHQMAEKEDFRQDLLFRINTIEIELPPLRERKGDIERLANHFTQVFGSKYDKGKLTINQNVWPKLNDYNWPGNVRELQHAVERAVIMCSSNELTEDHFLVKKSNPLSQHDSLKVEDVEKETIAKAIEKQHGNLTKAAEELGMGRSTLYRKMQKYGI